MRGCPVCIGAVALATVPSAIGDGFDVRSLSVTYRDGQALEKHTHPWAQLIYARKGVLYVETNSHVWFVPPTRAVWIPPGVSHRMAFKGEVALRTLYVSPQRGGGMPDEIVAFEVTPLLSHLIQHIQTLGMLDPTVVEHDHLASVLLDLICSARAIDMALPLPTHDRALQLALHLRDCPTDRRDLGALAKAFGASLRTMQRHFVDGTGIPLESWRQKARLIHSVATLAAGGSVQDAAHSCGYQGTSAYVAAFKKQFGVTPGRFDIGV